MVRIQWPDGKSFAFSIFDDPDGQTTVMGRTVYGALAELGFRTTKAIWPISGPGAPSDLGRTCEDPDYLAFVLELQADGFEIAYHNATYHTSPREQTILGLDRFRKLFGHDPRSMANHFACREDIYWGDQRLTGFNRRAYNLITRNKNRATSTGHIPGHENFWGDLCRERITYVRNFAFADINTLRACPYLPYHDPLRPFVQYWFAATDGADCDGAVRVLREENMGRLEAEGGACILYTHFGHGYVEQGGLRRDIGGALERLTKRNGWFAPVSDILDHIRNHRSDTPLLDRQRRRLERRWLLEKLRYGTR